MDEASTVDRCSYGALDRAAEEYLRKTAAGENFSLAEIAARHGVEEAALRAFVLDYDWFADLARRVSPGDRIEKPEVVRQFGDYQLIGKPLGRGGMGVVYKARQRSLDRIVAVKLIVAGALATPAEVRRFYDEARIAGSLKHAGIVPIHDVGRVEGQHFYSMELVEGQTLDSLIDRNGPLPSRDAAACLLACAEAVHYAHTHEKRVVHRDLKPSNILIDADARPRLADFGLAKQLRGDSRATETQGVLGTPCYMSPEQARADAKAVGEWTDVYGLGAVLYKCLAGVPPFQGARPLDVLTQVIHDEPLALRKLNAEVSRDLETICLKCLQKSPSSRYATAGDLVDDLGRYLRREPIVARPVGRVERLAMFIRRRPLVSALSACLVVSMIAGLIGVTSQYLRAEGALDIANQNLVRAEQNLEKAIDAMSFIGREVGEVELSAIPRVQKLQRRILEKAVEYNEALLQANQGDSAAELESSRASLRIADLQATLGAGPAAESAYLRAIDSSKRLAERVRFDGRGEAEKLVLRARYGLANLLIDSGRFDSAAVLLPVLRKALLEPYASVERATELVELSGAIDALDGRLALHEQHYETAVDCFQSALESTRQMVQRDGSNERYQRGEAAQQLGLGIALSRLAQYEESEKAYRAAIRLLEPLGQEAQLGAAWRDLAITQRKTDDLGSALRSYQRATEIFVPLVQFAPDSVRLHSDYAECFHGMSLVQLEQGHYADAAESLRSAVEAQRKVVQLDFTNVEFRQRLRNELYSLCDAHLRAGDHQAAAKCAEDFLEYANQANDHVYAAIVLLACREAASSDAHLGDPIAVGDLYARRAIEILRDARKLGLLTGDAIRSDDRFAELREYDEYSQLVER